MLNPAYCRPDADDLPARSWECQRCGCVNDEMDSECQWCDPNDWSAENAADHAHDHRKHG
jgi:hypothetical protein